MSGIQSLRLTFSGGHISEVSIWRRIADYLRRIDRVSEKPTLVNKKVSFEKMAATLERVSDGHFGIEDDYYVYDFGYSANYKFYSLFIDQKACQNESWDGWIAAFLDMRELVSARFYDDEYDEWQNTKDPSCYEIAGRPYEHLPMKSNGLPSPLERMEIDTSRNPGRYVFKEGYIEAIGATMWIGEPFWMLTGADKAAVLSAEWLEVSELPNHVLRIQAYPEAFTSAEGEQGELQNRLRDLLFPDHD